MSSFDSIAPTTELEAVNAVLATIGEAPLASQADIDIPATPDVATIITLFRRTMRQTLLKKFEFNTELGLRINPVTSAFAWTDADGTPQTLAIFKPPAGLLDFQVALRPDQQGAQYLDTVIRSAKVYTDGSPPAPALVFYDRFKNRDGFPASERSAIYIDAVWSLDFSDLPEVARQYVLIKTARLFQKDTVGSAEIHSFTAEEEAEAWKDLKRRHGLKTNFNALDNADVYRVRGLRPGGPEGFTDLRRGSLGLL